MQSTRVRRFAFIALLAAGVVVLGLSWPDDSPRDEGSSSERATKESSDPAARAGGRAPSAANGSDSISSTPTAVEPSRPSSQIATHLEVRAPSDAT
jgi:hypothetical protein